MTWIPPVRDSNASLRSLCPGGGWRAPIEAIARKHGLWPCELEPYAQGDAIVWRAGAYVVKLTVPECTYQIDAELGCLEATHGKLAVVTPRVCARGLLSGWPYVILERIGGRPLADAWPGLDHAQRRRLARSLAGLCRELHALPPRGFPTGWDAFWRACRTEVGRRHAGPPALLAAIDPFLDRVGHLDDSRLVPLHTELLDVHVYVQERDGQAELSGLIDFADARVGAAPYEFGALVGFIFKGERGLLREFLLTYGVPEAQLSPRYSETLLAWSLCHRFSNLERMLALVRPVVPRSLEELAEALFDLGDG
jgi:hygromycin-B 7''-O-kinase